MTSLDQIADDPRVRIRKGGLNAQAECVLYWMRRAQRAWDNPALDVAIQAGNVLKKPVLVFFGLSAKSHHANLRHYTFMIQGLRDVAIELRKRNIGFVLRSHPEHDILKFCAEVRPCLIVADENPLAGPERAQERCRQSSESLFGRSTPTSSCPRSSSAGSIMPPEPYDRRSEHGWTNS